MFGFWFGRLGRTIGGMSGGAPGPDKQIVSRAGIMIVDRFGNGIVAR